MKDTQFDWNESDYADDIYNREKYAQGGDIKKNISYREELTGIIFHIRKDLQCRRINVFVNQDLQIILSSPLEKVETMLTLMEIFEEINRLERAYLSDFDISNFEMVMEENKPTIYCSYERI